MSRSPLWLVRCPLSPGRVREIRFLQPLSSKGVCELAEMCFNALVTSATLRDSLRACWLSHRVLTAQRLTDVPKVGLSPGTLLLSTISTPSQFQVWFHQHPVSTQVSSKVPHRAPSPCLRGLLETAVSSRTLLGLSLPTCARLRGMGSRPRDQSLGP